MPSAVPQEDVPMEPMSTDAAPENDEVKAVESTLVAEVAEESGTSQGSDAADIEVTMADVAIADAITLDISIKGAVKSEVTETEVKLEDLFADMDSDEEFPSSVGPAVKVASSPEEPVSTV